MPSQLLEETLMASGKQKDRVEFRADPEWLDRVTAQAERRGLAVSAYIRLAVSERLHQDEAEAAEQDGRSKRPRK